MAGLGPSGNLQHKCGVEKATQILKRKTRLQQFQWQRFFLDPTQWWLLNPLLVHSGAKSPPESVPISVQGGRFPEHDGSLEVRMCLKLCADGRINEAVDALILLVQQGCYVPNNLFYRVLKRCIAQKDLVLGRRVHDLTIKSGYEGDAFLATHLIGLYASHGKVAEAMRVFGTVYTPDAYNWATIILAYARHGEPKQAILLYQQMRETNVKPDNHIFIAVLKACATAGDLAAGKDVHAHVLASARKPDMFVQNSLVDMYAKCGSLVDARALFDGLSHKDVVTWTAMIAGYAQHGMGKEALSLYTSMQQEGITFADSVTLVCLLQACATVGKVAVRQGKQLHAQVEQRGLQHDVVVASSLVNMYAKCSLIEDARRVFDNLSHRTVVTWNVMITGYVQQGMGHEALSLYSNMQREGTTQPNSSTFSSLLQACAIVGEVALHQGKQLHALIQERGLEDDVVVGGSLVNMYAKCSMVKDARRVFDTLPHRNEVTWTAMIALYAQQGMGQEALSLYSSMQQDGIAPPNSVTYVCLLQACATLGEAALHQGKQIHAQVEEQGLQDVVLGGSLVNMYVNCGIIEDARRAFDRLPHKNVVTCNVMLGGYVQQGMGGEALRLYRSIEQEGIFSPNSSTFVFLLQACASVGEVGLHQGKQLHAQIEEVGLQHDVVVGGSLVNMYVKCGCIEDAHRTFDRLALRNVVAWNAIIGGYAQQGMGQGALTLYSSMQQEGITQPDAVTFVCLLQACASMGEVALHCGKQLHTQVEERGLQDDVVVGGSLVNMFAKCGNLVDAREVFDRLPHKNVVAWNAMLAGYAQQGMGQEAIALYSCMQQEGITPPDSVTFVSVLQACAAGAALVHGKQLHAQIQERGLQADVAVGTGLVNMYSKCGSMLASQEVFDTLPERHVEAWTALITGYACQGDSSVVFDLLERMKQDGVQPNSITFLSVLAACSHGGLVDQGRKYFNDMKNDYGLCPTIKHYTCMMDLLGRAGHLEEALEMATTMPLPPNDAVWLTLLGACRKWNNVEIGRQAFEFVVSLDETVASSYVLMASIYADAQMWEDAKEIEGRRVNSKAWKQPGHSWWTDMGGVMHTFAIGDK